MSAAAKIYNIQREKLEALESELKQHFVDNEEARATMQRRLEESANAAQGLFAQLLERVSQPLLNANDIVSSSAAMLLNQQSNVSSSNNNSKVGTKSSRHQRQSVFGNRKGKTNKSTH